MHNRAPAMTTKERIEDALMDALGFCFEHGMNLFTLFAGAFLVGVAVVMAFLGVHQIYLRPGDIDLFFDALRIAIILTAFFIGIKMMKASDYTERIFSRW